MKLSDPTLVRVGRTVGALAVLSTLVGIVLILLVGQAQSLVDDFIFEFAVPAVGFGVFAWVAIPAQPRNPAVWLPAVGALAGGLFIAASATLSMFITAAGIEASSLTDMKIVDVFDRVNHLAAIPLILATFVYGSLAAFIGVVYVGVVVGIGAVFGAGSDPNALLAIVATALIAVAFQPLRARFQKVANRVVYGKKAKAAPASTGG